MDTMTRSAAATTVDDEEALSATVVSAVADAKGVDPLELEPLYKAVDADALDAIFSHADGDDTALSVSFSMAGCQVVVRGAGEVVVTPETEADAVAPCED